MAVIIDGGRKSFNFLYSRSKTVEIETRKIYASEAVIDIGFRPFIEPLIYVSILKKQKDTVNEDDSLKQNILSIEKNTLWDILEHKLGMRQLLKRLRLLITLTYLKESSKEKDSASSQLITNMIADLFQSSTANTHRCSTRDGFVRLVHYETKSQFAQMKFQKAIFYFLGSSFTEISDYFISVWFFRL